MAKVLVILGHPDKNTFCGALATAYESGAKEAGFEVKRINVGDLKFDPILHKGYKEIQELEPDLVGVQEAFLWADHVVIIYPNWWASMPALLKGMIDRVFLPRFAYKFHENHLGWDKLLKGKSARVIITMDSWPIIERLFVGDFTNEITRGILKFSGIHPVRLTKIGPVKTMSEEKRKHWIEKIGEFGKKGK